MKRIIGFLMIFTFSLLIQSKAMAMNEAPYEHTAAITEDTPKIIRNAFTHSDIKGNFESFADSTAMYTKGLQNDEGVEVIGLIYDENTGDSISQASITFEEVAFSALCDKNGKFSCQKLPEGVYTVIVAAEGYVPASFLLPARSEFGKNIYSLPLSRKYDASNIVKIEEHMLEHDDCCMDNDMEGKSISLDAKSRDYTTPTLPNISVLYNDYIYEFGSNINDYLYYVVAHEMLTPQDSLYDGISDTQKLEALKAQAVAARTYATTRATYGNHLTSGYNFCSLEHCQYYGPWYTNSLVVQAVDATTHEIVYDTVNDRKCDTFFFASCNGHTKSYNEVWGGNVSYLVSVSCPYDLRMSYESGHGVGMCQDGAMGYAKQNYGYELILSHYYSGTSVITANPCVANGLVIGETKRVSVSSSATTEFLTYVNTSATYSVEIHQAGTVTCTPVLRIYNSSGNLVGTKNAYGPMTISLSQGEYRITVTANTSAEVKVGIINNVYSPIAMVNLTNTGNSNKTHKHYLNGVVRKVYKFTPTASGTYVFETSYFKLSSDTLLVVKNTSGTVIGQNDDYGGTYYSRLSLSLSANNTYYVIVGGYGFDATNNTGAMNINCKLTIAKQ